MWPSGAVAGADRSAGQAAAAGGPQAAWRRFSHSCSRCQPAGRWRVRWPRPCRAVRAATTIRSRRMVAARAFANGRDARAPAARSKLCAMAVIDSPAAFAAKTPDGRCARGPLVTSAKTCSTTAWSRCCSSAWTSANGESVKTAWYRQTGNSSSCPAAAFLLRSRPDPGPTLRPHHRKTAGAGPKHYPHPPCRIWRVVKFVDCCACAVQIIRSVPARRRGSGWRLCGQRLCGELWSGERVGSPSRMSSVREVMFSLVKTLRRW